MASTYAPSSPTAPLNTSLPAFRSSPPSPVAPLQPSLPFAFPRPPASSIAPYLSSNGVEVSPITPASSTLRFHEALAGIPSRHRPTSSAASSAASSTSSSSAFRFPPDSASPTGDTAFGTLQKELGTGSRVVGLGLAEAVFGSRGPSPSFGRNGSATPDGRLFEEPEQLEDFTGAYGEVPRRRGESSGREEFGLDEELDDFDGATEAGMGGGIGRPASMDMGGDSETSFDFLLSPPPSFDLSTSTTRQFAAAASDTPRPKERSRTFPAPLLLKGDRPFGVSGAPAAFASMPPLRKATIGSVPSGNNLPSTQPPPRQWAPQVSTVFPPPPTDLNRANAPFQRHRYQHSPNSSLTQLSTSQSSISYSHTPSASASLSSVPTASSSISSLSTANTSLSHSMSTSVVDPPIAPQALLLHILSLRSASNPMSLSQSQGPASRSGIPLVSAPSHQRIKSAGSASSDNEESNTPPRSSSTGRLDTVDLSHKRIAEVPIEVIEELRDEVEKLALGYNLLRGLSPHFSALGSKLKYLNVRVNMLTVFPQVLCEMPSLEILDISRNKIKFLPTVPGTLVNLKVFSIAKNRIKRLPTYLAQMAHLKVLKIDHNPLEWPPREITVFPTAGQGGGSALSDGDARRTGGSRVEDAEEMARWLPNLVRWIRENGDDRRVDRPSHSAEQTSDEERPSAEDHKRTPRAENGRLFSATANPAFAGTRPLRITTSSQPGLRSPFEPPSLDPPSPLDEDQSLRLHGRNASHSTMQSLEPGKRPGLKSKKSLPDLRLSHADILAERRTGSAAEDEGRATMPSVASALRRLKEDRRPGIVHANSSRAALPTQLALPSSAPASSALSLPGAAPRSQSARAVPTTLSRSTGVRPAPPPSSATRAGFEQQSKTKRSEVDTSANGLDRNSGAYFRRLSMLPTSTISKAVPVPLLEFADAIRGILFSLSQIYTALRQFVVFASQDRLPAPLARLMGTADGSMSLLINALDRFDSLSRRGTPNPTIVRDIFVTCRDNVVTFGKLVTALAPQLKALVATADVRYTRTLLLMLYGSMGEIANSWNAVSPLLEEMTVLNEDPSLATLILQPPTPSPTSLSSSTSSRPGPAGVGSLYRARSKSRRHAGSFSVEDVQLGAVIPPAPFPPPTPSLTAYPAELPSGLLSASSASASSLPNDSWAEGTIKIRPGKSSRTLIPHSIPMPSQPGYRDLVLNAFDHPMTPSGTALMLSDPPDDPMSASTYASLNNLGSSLPMPPNSAASRTDTFAVPRSEGLRNGSTANADELFLNLVEATTSIAFDVYGMLLNSFDEDADGDDDEGAGVLMRDLGPRRTKELTDMCILGNETTTKLRGALGRVRGPEGMHGSLSFSPADAKRLGDESYAFVQTVIRFAKLVKATSVEHGFAPRIREGVGQLTIATREFAKHLSHTATSFRPAAPGVTSTGGAVLRS